jgi:Xaa-Pro aminopeptidase
MHPADTALCSPVSRGELERRWAVLRSIMAAHGADTVIAQASNDWLGGYVRWLTGAPANNAYPRSVVLPLEGKLSVVSQGAFDGLIELDGTQPESPGVGRHLFTPSYVSAEYTAHYDAELVLKEVSRLGGRRVALLGPAGMYHGFARRLLEGLHGLGAETLDVTGEVDLVKAIKSPEEQALIEHTARMQDAVLARLCEFIRPGLHDFEVAAYAQYIGQTLGSEQGIFIGSSAPAGRPAVFRPRSQQGRTLAKGDVLTLLIENNGPGGYYTELLRPIVLGQASAEYRETWAFLLEAQRFTLEQLQPGRSCQEIFAQYNAFLARHGQPPEQRLHCHGQGYDMVERPLIRNDEPMSIRPGMNIVVHPAVKTASVFMTLVDNYLIGEHGPGRSIHHTPQHIIELDS